jgi:predicted HTH transcriptional regulator
VQWYVALLQRRTQTDIRNPHELLREMLLDGRGEATQDEARQLLLLFGSGSEVKRLLRRELLDLLARLSEETSRWDERQEIATNVLTALRQALAFVSKHHPVLKVIHLDDLQATTGSTDYIAVREALVNLIIHQDYADQRTVAQIELEPERTTMTNAGFSLASHEELRDGGTSTARNPLIARALKLIGFAELGGSGLRETYRVWRQAKRRPVLVASDKDSNRFRLTLDSRPLELVEDTLWK